MNKRMGRPKKLSERDKRTILRQIRLLRCEDGNWTIKRLMEISNVTHVSQRTVTRLLHQNGYKYLQARKKGLLSEKDKKDRVKFARKMLKNYDEDVWKNDIAFYLDGVSFAYKRNPDVFSCGSLLHTQCLTFTFDSLPENDSRTALANASRVGNFL